MEQETRKSLYSITEDISLVEQLFIENGGELTPELEDLQAKVSAEVENKTDSCVGFLKMQRDKLEAFTVRSKEISAAKTVLENNIKRYEAYLVECVLKSGQKEFVGKFTKIKTRKPTKKVNIIDKDKVPMEFLKEKTEVSIDSKGIAAAIKAGQEVDGCQLIDGKIGINVTFNS